VIGSMLHGSCCRPFLASVYAAVVHGILHDVGQLRNRTLLPRTSKPKSCLDTKAQTQTQRLTDTDTHVHVHAVCKHMNMHANILVNIHVCVCECLWICICRGPGSAKIGFSSILKFDLNKSTQFTI
jgi:hypothetical protein